MKQVCTRLGAVLLICGILLFFQEKQSKYAAIAYGEPVDIYADGFADVQLLEEGLPIDADTNMLMGSFGYSEVTYEDRPKDKYYYYILPIPVGQSELYFVACEVSAKSADYKTYEKLAEETMAYIYMEADTLSSEEIHLSGGLVELDADLYNYMLEEIEQIGWFEDEATLRKYVLPLTFTSVDKTYTKNLFTSTMTIIVVGTVLLLYGLLVDIRYAPRLKQLRALRNRTVNIAGVDYCIALMKVDRMIWAGKTKKAKKELMKVYKASEDEADRIIQNWDAITSLPRT